MRTAYSRDRPRNTPPSAHSSSYVLPGEPRLFNVNSGFLFENTLNASFLRSIVPSGFGIPGPNSFITDSYADPWQQDHVTQDIPFNELAAVKLSVYPTKLLPLARPPSDRPSASRRAHCIYLTKVLRSQALRENAPCRSSCDRKLLSPLRRPAFAATSAVLSM